MNIPDLRHRVRAGEYVFGTLVTAPLPKWAEVVRGTGVDFVFIDWEHIPLDRGQIAFMCQMYRAQGLAPIVRIPSPDPHLTRIVMDGGAAGVVASYVETVQEARSICDAVRYQPLKGQLLENVSRETAQLNETTSLYLEERNGIALTIVNIESVPALENLGAIVAAPGLDAILIGPHDLSVSLGVPEEYDNPVFLEAVSTIIRTGRSAGIGVGIHFSWGVDAQIHWAREGLNMIINNSDINAFYQSMRADIFALRNALDADNTPDAAGRHPSITI